MIFGFVPADAAWWPAIRDGLAKPWPKEAAMMDLRWHADRERMGDKANAMPGRPTLLKRWGWQDWDVRQLLKSPEWIDRWTQDPEEDSTSATPAPLQPASSRTPAAQRANANKGIDSTSATPAPLQPASSFPPSRDPLLTDHRSPITDHRSQDPAAPDSTKPSNDPNLIDPPIADPPSLIETPPVEVLPPRQTSGQPPRPLFAPPVAPGGRMPIDPPRPPEPTRAPRQPNGTAASVAVLYAAWKANHPRSADDPTPSTRKALQTLLVECGNEHMALTYLDWVADSMDERAMQIRGDAPWPGGKASADHNNLPSHASNVAGRLGMVEAWDARGRVNVHPRPGPAPSANRPSKQAEALRVIAQMEYEGGLEVIDAPLQFALTGK